MSNVFLITGDAGDDCASLCVMRHLGGGECVIGMHIGHGAPREPMTEGRANFMLPLISAQKDYITSARYGEKSKSGLTHDLSTFRANAKFRSGESLVNWHCRNIGIDPRKVDTSPWLKVEPSQETAGKVIFTRSPRYHGKRFPWPKFVSEHGKRAIFIGLPDEHASFEREYGSVTHRPVKDALEMAQLIAGSERIYCNQSLPCWIALGLGHPMVQETWLHAPNSRLPRQNAKYIF